MRNRFVVGIDTATVKLALAVSVVHTEGLQSLRICMGSRGTPHLPSLFGEYLLDLQAVQEGSMVPDHGSAEGGPRRPPVW